MRLGKEQAAGYVEDMETQVPVVAETVPVPAAVPEPVLVAEPVALPR